eukprot:1186764-Prorocentrum_minimum.AAC.1
MPPITPSDPTTGEWLVSVDSPLVDHVGTLRSRDAEAGRGDGIEPETRLHRPDVLNLRGCNIQAGQLPLLHRHRHAPHLTNAGGRGRNTSESLEGVWRGSGGGLEGASSGGVVQYMRGAPTSKTLVNNVVNIQDSQERAPCATYVLLGLIQFPYEAPVHIGSGGGLEGRNTSGSLIAKWRTRKETSKSRHNGMPLLSPPRSQPLGVTIRGGGDNMGTRKGCVRQDKAGVRVTRLQG